MYDVDVIINADWGCLAIVEGKQKWLINTSLLKTTPKYLRDFPFIEKRLRQIIILLSISTNRIDSA